MSVVISLEFFFFFEIDFSLIQTNNTFNQDAMDTTFLGMICFPKKTRLVFVFLKNGLVSSLIFIYFLKGKTK